MRVVYVLSTGPLYGDNIALRAILPTLVNLGVDPLIIVPNESDSHREFDKLGYKCIGYRKNYSAISTTANPYKAIYRFLRRELQRWKSHETEYQEILGKVRDFNPELVHTNCGYVDLGIRLSLSLHVPHVMHVREYGLLGAHIRHFPSDEWFAIQQRFFGYNITITENLQLYFKLPTRNTQAIYDGVYPVGKPYTLFEKKENYILFVGRIVELKGVREAVDAFCEIAHDDESLEFWLAGEGDQYYYDEQIQVLREHNLLHRVRFLGYRTDIWELMSKAKVVVIPSEFEGFGFVAAEAIFNGCPVIGKSTAGIQEQYENLRDLEPGTPMFWTYTTFSDFVQALRDSLSKSYDMNTMQKYHDRVSELYSSITSGTKILGFYNKILKK